ncbi:MAG: hypothetical protein GY950_10105 [bacterium]|nr:hypothetical protein [bacterium]
MKHNKINPWVLERYILNELPKNQMEEIDLRLKDDAGLRKEIEELRNSNKEILARYPAESVAPGILDRLHVEKSKEKYEKERLSRSPVLFRRLAYAAPALVLVLAVLFTVLPVREGTLDPGQITLPDGTRIKGDQTIDMTKPNLMIYRQKNDAAELLKKGVIAKAGDLLQIAYVAGGEPNGVILSIDGNGVVTLHYPEKITQTTALLKKKKVFLGSAYELDEAPGFERFFFITSKTKINVNEVLTKAKQLARDTNRAQKGSIELKNTLKQTSFLIVKGE